MSERHNGYDPGEVVGDDPGSDVLREAIPQKLHQTAATARKLLSSSFDFCFKINDKDKTEHELPPEDIATVTSDEETEGGFRVTKRDGAVIAVLGAAVLSAGVVIYKKTRR